MFEVLIAILVLIACVAYDVCVIILIITGTVTIPEVLGMVLASVFAIYLIDYLAIEWRLRKIR